MFTEVSNEANREGVLVEVPLILTRLRDMRLGFDEVFYLFGEYLDWLDSHLRQLDNSLQFFEIRHVLEIASVST